MTLSDILAGVPIRSGIPALISERQVTGLDYDSRRLAPGFVFFAFAGSRSDGTQFAGQALEKGAVAIVGELPAPAGLEDSTVARPRPPRWSASPAPTARPPRPILRTPSCARPTGRRR
ncbi:MAG: Mur ligase domain-containing protein [Acidobacteria bacterium]|nr:Mur ligase domain-containing protein [Acidobacteriota bacterium]